MIAERQPHNIPRGTKRQLPREHGFDPKAISYHWDADGTALARLLRGLLEGERLSVDLETTGLDPYTSKVTIVGISKDGRNVILIDPEVIKLDKDLHVDFNWAMQAKNIGKVFHNAKFDMKMLSVHLGSSFNNSDCTYIMRRALICGLDHSSSLDACAYEYLGYLMDKSVRDKFIGNTVITDEMKEYAAIDVAATWHLFPILDAYIDQEQLRPMYGEIERDLPWVVAKMELEGIDVDAAFLKELEVMMTAKVDKFQSELDATLKVLKVMPTQERKLKKAELTYDQMTRGVTHVREYLDSLNVNSSKQVKHVLNTLGLNMVSTDAASLDEPKYTKESLNQGKQNIGRVITDAALVEIALDTCQRISALRKAEKAVGSFVIPLQSKFNNPVTGRVHASFNQMGTNTGRFSCSEPNLQQIPSPNRDKVFDGVIFRKAFKAPPGKKLMVYDYNACELRILAEMSNDDKLIHSLTQPDIHRANAALMYNKKPEDVTKTEREAAKAAFYLTSYGGGPNRLAAVLKLPFDQAKTIIETLLSTFEDLARWIDARKRMAMNSGYSISLSGRRRYYDMPNPTDFDARVYRGILSSIGRKGQNTPIQATNADITKLAMVWVDRALEPYGAKLVLSVHDELVATCPEDTVEEAFHVMGETMLAAEREFLRRVPAAVNGQWGDTWEH